jgi:hypothetical protein
MFGLVQTPTLRRRIVTIPASAQTRQFVFLKCFMAIRGSLEPHRSATPLIVPESPPIADFWRAADVVLQLPPTGVSTA